MWSHPGQKELPPSLKGPYLVDLVYNRDSSKNEIGFFGGWVGFGVLFFVFVCLFFVLVILHFFKKKIAQDLLCQTIKNTAKNKAKKVADRCYNLSLASLRNAINCLNNNNHILPSLPGLIFSSTV